MFIEVTTNDKRVHVINTNQIVDCWKDDNGNWHIVLSGGDRLILEPAEGQRFIDQLPR